MIKIVLSAKLLPSNQIIYRDAVIEFLFGNGEVLKCIE